jgi:hypothetical protein
MPYLVNENPRELRARAIERDSPFAQKRACVYRPATVPKTARKFHPYRRAC